jgi:hypothetical protein
MCYVLGRLSSMKVIMKVMYIMIIISMKRCYCIFRIDECLFPFGILLSKELMNELEV